MKLNSMQKYNLKWAKDKLRSDKKNARDMLEIYKQQKKEIYWPVFIMVLLNMLKR